MERILIAILFSIILFLLICLLIKLYTHLKWRRIYLYFFSSLIVSLITAILYLLLTLLFENYIKNIFDDLILYISSIPVSLLISSLFLNFLQKMHEKKILKQIESKYPQHDFEYYRELLKENSPGIMSLCFDLSLPNFEDTIVSIFLSLEEKDILKIEDHKVMIKNEDISNLQSHEMIVIKYLKNKTSLNKFKNDFTESLKKDACQAGYLKRVSMVNIPQIAELLILVLIVGLLIIIPVFQGLESELGFLLFFAYFLIFVSIPVYQKMKEKVGSLSRTEKGFELAAQLHGMKNFLRDFSNVEEHHLKELKIYEEYLIYSVLFNFQGNLNQEVKHLYDTIILDKPRPLDKLVKRKNYQEEKNHNLIFALVFMAIFLFVIYMMSREKDHGGIVIGMWIFGGITFLMFLSFVYLVIKRRKYFATITETILYGEKVPGMIVKKDYDLISDSEGGTTRKNYVEVAYVIHNQSYVVRSPYLAFSPEKILSNEVDVYVYNGRFYIDNYKLEKN